MEIFIKKYLWAVHIFGIMLCAYFLAKTVSVFLAGQLSVERQLVLSSQVATAAAPVKTIASFDSYKIIIDRNIFDSKDTAPASTESLPTETPNLDGPAVRTTLSVKLLSTFSVGMGADRRSTATIQSANGGTVEVYTVADEKQFAPGVQITKILPDRIEFINGGRLEYLEIEKLSPEGVSTGSPFSKLENPSLPKPGGVAKQGENKFVVDQAEIDNALNNLDKLFTEVRAVPNFVGGKPAGLKLLALTPGTLLSKLGLQRGDVLEQINGVNVDIQKGLEIFNQLRGEKRVVINLVRNGQKQTLDYDIR